MDLFIFHNNQKVGVLRYDQVKDLFSIAYDDVWKTKGFELSPHLKFDEEIRSASIKKFIHNILPEGEHLDTISRIYQISKSNGFGILSRIGHDTAGSLMFLNPDEKPATSFRHIPKDELRERIKERSQKNITIWDGKPRISVAGVQDKLPVLKIDGEYGLGEGDLCSTHLLKFAKGDNNLVLNEYLTMRLASDIGLNVASVELVKFDDIMVLEVERFDRVLVSSALVRRKHIIDGCQALDLDVKEKYERNFGSTEHVKNIRDGVSLPKLFDFINECKIPALAKQDLIRWSIYNLIAGNSDAHGKNISFMVEKGSIKVAPFYDIVNVRLYGDEFEQEMAMAIDDEFNFEKLKPYDFFEFCETNNIKKKFFYREFTNIASNIEKTLIRGNFPEVCDMPSGSEFFKRYSEALLGHIMFLDEQIKESLNVNLDEST